MKYLDETPRELAAKLRRRAAGNDDIGDDTDMLLRRAAFVIETLAGVEDDRAALARELTALHDWIDSVERHFGARNSRPEGI